MRTLLVSVKSGKDHCVLGFPEDIIVDNGPEFVGNVLDELAYERGAKLNFIRSWKPIENAHIKSFNGKFRDECLNQN